MPRSLNCVARIRVQEDERTLAFSAEPNKGDDGECEALVAISVIERTLFTRQDSYRTFSRNTAQGDIVDCLVVNK